MIYIDSKIKKQNIDIPYYYVYCKRGWIWTFPVLLFTFQRNFKKINLKELKFYSL